MNRPIVLTVIARDEPGIIRAVSEILKEHGGNWTRSSMSSLAGHFAGILQAFVPEESVEHCLGDLEGLASRGIQIIARVGGDERDSETTRRFHLSLVGNDRPGIVHDITRVIARHDVNVENLKTSVESASMAGGDLFRAEADLHVSESTRVDALARELEDLANDLMVDIRLDR